LACSWVRARSESPRRDPRKPFSPPDSPKRCYRPEDRSSSAGRGPWTSADDPSPSPRSIPRSSESLARRATGALHVLMGADHLCALAVVAAPGEADLRPAERASSRGDAAPRRADDAASRTYLVSPNARAREHPREDSEHTEHTERLSAHRATFLKSLALGVRWGVGHAAGLALVCAVFFSAKGRVSLDGVGDVTDKVVGASMVLLGVLALAQLRAWRRRRALERAHLDDALVNAAAHLQPHAEGRRLDLEARRGAGALNEIDKTKARSPPASPLAILPGSAAHARAHDLDLPHTHGGAGTEKGVEPEPFPLASDGKKRGLPRDDAPRDGDDDVSEPPRDALDADVERGWSSAPVDADVSCAAGTGTRTRTERERAATHARARWSFAIGFSHGVASPSGILSVLPAVVLDDSAKATAYLVAFFITSTASMGAFAGAFGLVASLAAAAAAADPARDPAARVSDAPARVAMGLNLFAGAAAVAIGVAWLALSAAGKLGDL